MTQVPPLNAFNWHTGPSCMATDAEANKAAQHAKNAGKALDSQSRATVNLAPAFSGISLSKNPQADAGRNARIRGRAL
jgi:hypothetical protein